MRNLNTRRAILAGIVAVVVGMAVSRGPGVPAAAAQAQAPGVPRAAAQAQGGRGTTPAPSPAAASRVWPDLPKDIAFTPVNFYSEGVRLQGQIIYTVANQGRRLPTVVSATGWGGVVNSFRGPAVEMARGGYAVFLFDYRGWGGSDGRMVLSAASRPPEAGGPFTAEVQELRLYVNPWEQVEDWFSAINFVAAQPWVDADRIGIRGASFSGGHVVYVAAHEPRVKAVVSLIGAFDGHPERWVVDRGQPAQVVADRSARAARLATGDAAAFPPPGQATPSRLRGSVPGNALTRWNAADSAHKVTSPVLFVLAANEELYDNANHGIRACSEVRGPRKMLLVPDTTHYDLYRIEGDLATKAGIDWFDRHLLGPGAPTRAQRENLTLPTEPARGDCRAPFVRTPGTKRGAGPGRGAGAPSPR